MIKRAFDLFMAFFALLILSPAFIVIIFLILIGSKGPIFYSQIRVGKGNVDFKLFKFRTMYPNSHKSGLLTVGGRDPRITPTGYYLRKYKLDELPQLINILKGDMSIVGPRPEVRKYVEMYNELQMSVLNVRPGLTDYASLEYINENEILGKSDNPELLYIEEVMPAKLEMNLKYIAEKSLTTDIKIIFKTFLKIFKN